MKIICLDVRALQVGHENRGIGMYVRNLLENLNDSENKYIIYCFDTGNPLQDLNIDVSFDYTIVQTPYINPVISSPRDVLNALKLIFHKFTPLSNMEVDVFVQFDYVLGVPNFRKTKTVVIGYDLIPLIRRSEYMPSASFAWKNSVGKRTKIRSTLRAIYYQFKNKLHYGTYKKADHIICISYSAAQTFQEILGIKKSKISAIPLAPVIDETTHKPSSHISLPAKPYIFYIGGTDIRKRISHLVRAFNITRGRGTDISLVLAGNEFTKVNEIPDIAGRTAILDSPYVDDIHLVGFVNNSDKKYLFQNALAFVFTTAYEGFGLPILEAMTMSCPVVSYENSSIKETAGNAALLVEDGNYPKIAEAILRIQNDRTLKNELVVSGVEQAKKFSWGKTAASTVKIFNSL